MADNRSQQPIPAFDPARVRRVASFPSPSGLTPAGTALARVSENNPLAEFLPLEVALWFTGQQTREEIPLDDDALADLMDDPAFARQVDEQVVNLMYKGKGFRLKARLQAERYLAVADEMIHSQDIPAAVRMDAIKSVARWAGYDTPPPVDGGLAAPGGVAIQINLGRADEPTPQPQFTAAEPAVSTLTLPAMPKDPAPR